MTSRVSCSVSVLEKREEEVHSLQPTLVPVPVLVSDPPDGRCSGGGSGRRGAAAAGQRGASVRRPHRGARGAACGGRGGPLHELHISGRFSGPIQAHEVLRVEGKTLQELPDVLERHHV